VAKRGEVERQVHALPRPRTSFVGRARELAALARLLDEAPPRSPRVVTLTGAPGAGKTRLAVEAAMRLVAEGTFTDVGFVDLSGLGSGDTKRVLERVADTAQVLSGERVLLIVDNFEQVLDAAVDLARLLEGLSGIWTIVTTQRALGFYGELQLMVPPLPTPPREGGAAADIGGYETVQLFVERARAHMPEFELTDANAATVAGVCRRLDGLPLAIELAAARVKLLPPESLLRRLEDRLGVLTGGPRDVPTRHRTLRAAIDWSYQLLEPNQQRVLRLLAVFAGAFNLAAAEAVVGTHAALLLDALQVLLDSGLLRVERADGEPRYRMLQTIREYALELLGDSDDAEAVRQRYADYYVHAGAHQSATQTRLAPADDENLRHALASILADSVERSRLADDRHQQAMALDGLGGLALTDGDLDLARARFEESARLFLGVDDKAGLGIAKLHLGQVLALSGHRTEARRVIESAIVALQQAGERVLAATALLDLAQFSLEAAEAQSALQHLVEGLRLAAEAREPAAVALTLEALAGVVVERGRPHTAALWLGLAAAQRAVAAAARSELRHHSTASANQTARAALGDAPFAAAWAEGQAMRVEQAVEQALALQLTGFQTPVEAAVPIATRLYELSPREREVAALIARGHTNRAIAEALVITEWTVDSHVRHILTKLKVRSRAQVAAWAVERGLVTSSPP
jgi:predicted ATPase/DNA-binding NarL/FixJ family response regulator